MIRIIQRILLTAVFPLLILSWMQINRIQKNIRERKGDVVLQENKRFAAVGITLLICFTGSQVLGEYLDHPDISVWMILLKMGWAGAAYVTGLFLAVQTFEKKGQELKKDGR